MNIHDIQQGSQEWLALRQQYFTASEAPAMMGDSKYQSRTALLLQKKTGYAPEIDAAKQRLFAAGHAAEAAARPFAEEIIGQELFPVTCSVEIDGLPLLASLDGLTLDESIVWEHKLWNEQLAADIRNGQIAPHYYWQLEHQLLVTGAARALFMVTSENGEAAEYCWYESNPERRSALLAGWKQFALDLAEYQHIEDKPPIVAHAIDDLPSLDVRISGSVISSNLDAWREHVIARVREINTDLQTDEDFAVAEKTVKFLAEGEKRLEIVKSEVQAQSADIDAVFRTIDTLRAEMRAKRLNLDKLVKARKESIRMEIMQNAQAKLAEHVKQLNERIGWFNGIPLISPAAADFASAIKSKKTVASLRDACATELARAKIATSELADRIESNRKAMGDHAALFPDFPHVCSKTPEDFANLVAVRVQQQQAAEAKREAERDAPADPDLEAPADDLRAADDKRAITRAAPTTLIRITGGGHHEPTLIDKLRWYADDASRQGFRQWAIAMRDAADSLERAASRVDAA